MRFGDQTAEVEAQACAGPIGTHRGETLKQPRQLTGAEPLPFIANLQSPCLLCAPELQPDALPTAAVVQSIEQQVLDQSLQRSRLIVVSDLATALRISNDYAPEHLILQLRDARQHLPAITSAGSIFLGAWSPEPMGDYCSGTNHVLPTYGYARAYSGLSVHDFLTRITVQELTPDGLRGLGPTASVLAGIEGLDAHALAVDLRLAAL